MRARSGLGVVLDAEGGDVTTGQTLDDAVVEVDVGDVDAGEGAFRDGVIVVLAGDFDRVGGQPADRVVAAVMTEGQLVGRGPEGGGQELVPQADAEHRYLPEELTDGGGGVTDGRRVPRAVGEEHPVRLAGQHLGRGRRGRDDLTVARWLK